MARALGLVLAVCIGCHQSSPSARAPASPVDVEPPRDREFAIFTQRHLLMEKLNVPTAAPLTVGSRASPATMVSDDPDVVAVAEDGSLVARRRGATVVRGVTTASTLLVEVVGKGNRIAVDTSRKPSRTGGHP